MSERLKTTINKSARFDRVAGIQGSFTIEDQPDIESPGLRVPIEAQIACVGLVVPMRFPDLVRRNFISIQHDDLIASLLLQDREWQADLFDAERRRVTEHRLVNWGISATVGRVAIGLPVTTEEYYRTFQATASQL
jgi:hypothetical protein